MILFSTLVNSKLPPPKSATKPSTFLNPTLTPSAVYSASSLPDKIFNFVLNKFSTS